MSDLIKDLRDRAIHCLHDKKLSSELRQAADLIEQQQREIADTERERSALEYELSAVRESEQALAAHVEQAKNLYAQMTQTIEFADNGEGCYVVDGKLMTDFADWYLQSPQASLAEVRARQAEESYLIGWDASSSDFNKCVGKKQDLAKQHANKIRINGKDNE